MPRKTRIFPLLLSARKTSPFGAVRISRGLSNPVAYCWTVNPLGALGHALRGRATTLGPLLAVSVAYGAGRSCTVILRLFPGSSKRKSVNGGVGGGALVLMGFVLALEDSTACGSGEFLSDFR